VRVFHINASNLQFISQIVCSRLHVTHNNLDRPVASTDNLLCCILCHSLSTATLSVTDHPVSGISFPSNFACLQLIMTTYHSHLISHTSVRHFLHHHCHHPLLLLSFTPGSKLVFYTNHFQHSSATFPPTRLTPWTLAVFPFSRACRF